MQRRNKRHRKENGFGARKVTYFCRGVTFEECIKQNTRTIQAWKKYFLSKGNKYYNCLCIDDHIKKCMAIRFFNGGYFSYTKDKVNCLKCFEIVNTKVERFAREKWLCLDRLGYKPFYWVSNFGRVKTLYDSKERLMSLRVNKDGYFDVKLVTQTNKDQRVNVHMLVMKMFGQYEVGKVIDHIDADRQNNKISNLRMLTQKENIRHGVSLGHYTKQWRNRNKANNI